MSEISYPGDYLYECTYGSPIWIAQERHDIVDTFLDHWEYTGDFKNLRKFQAKFKSKFIEGKDKVPSKNKSTAATSNVPLIRAAADSKSDREIMKRTSMSIFRAILKSIKIRYEMYMVPLGKNKIPYNTIFPNSF